MRIYAKEIPGTKNERNEDSYYTTNFEHKGKEFSLALVADGCSGYNGSLASHLAAHDLGHTIRERILNGEGDYTQIIRSCVDDINTALCQKASTRTTLDLLLLSQDYGCIAHVGDGRVYADTSEGLIQITSDESSQNGPSNYLGAYYVDNKIFADRISLKEFDEKELNGINGFLLATDGLWSRVPENYFIPLFKKSQDIGYLFDSIEREVYSPHLKIKELNEEVIKAEFRMIFTSLGLSVKGSAAELSERLYNLYMQRNADTVSRLDKKVIPFDDTTLVYVDRYNVIDSLLQERMKLKTIDVPGLESKVKAFSLDVEAKAKDLLQKDDEIAGMRVNLETQTATAQEAYAVLQGRYDVLNGDYRAVCAVRDGLQTEKDGLVEENTNLGANVALRNKNDKTILDRFSSVTFHRPNSTLKSIKDAFFFVWDDKPKDKK